MTDDGHRPKTGGTEAAQKPGAPGALPERDASRPDEREAAAAFAKAAYMLAHQREKFPSAMIEAREKCDGIGPMVRACEALGDQWLTHPDRRRVPRSGWQPIETLPHDGSVGLAAVSRDGATELVGWGGEQWMSGGMPAAVRDYDRWMSIPEPPEVLGE